jgi:hypothetical protein
VKRSIQLILVAVVLGFVGSVAGPAIYESSVQAQGIVIPERHVGHFQVSAFGTHGSYGCFIVDTKDGQVWRVDGNGSPKSIGTVGEK